MQYHLSERERIVISSSSSNKLNIIQTEYDLIISQRSSSSITSTPVMELAMFVGLMVNGSNRFWQIDFSATNHFTNLIFFLQ